MNDELYFGEVRMVLEQLVRGLHAALHRRHEHNAGSIISEIFRVWFGVLCALGLQQSLITERTVHQIAVTVNSMLFLLEIVALIYLLGIVVRLVPAGSSVTHQDDVRGLITLRGVSGRRRERLLNKSNMFNVLLHEEVD